VTGFTGIEPTGPAATAPGDLATTEPGGPVAASPVGPAATGAAAAAAAVAGRAAAHWVEVCRFDDLQPERGACALVGDYQVAIFRMHDGALYAVSNRDPFSGAYVLARGIVGSRRGVPTVASPMYKQVFDLRTGRCLDDPATAVPTFPVRRVRPDGPRGGTRVAVGVPPASSAGEGLRQGCTGHAEVALP
jgi:nitrite reductase (NADH) small subunit